MKNPIQWLRSLIFITQMYLAMLVLGIVFAPWAALSPKGARIACKSFARWALWTARWMVGIRTEVRGQVPEGEVIIAAKHQSFLDIIIIFNAVPSARFIMKRELMWTPVIGVYAKRLGCVPVDRGKRGAAIAKMVKDVAKESREPGQLIIYSQGTRVAPGARKPYKIGTAVLYEGLKQPCVPAATNVGVFWPRTGIYRKPGLAVVEFLEPMQPGIARAAFMAQLESRVESRSDELMREAGFEPDAIPQQH
ncbi:1-acyl-sn-glycerol-3-phosphate acyltransferase [Leisingera daeponensis]|uniref:1-acyl-sn-glycerol-3-phosphate acyltransferase n=1 Tax=Leisingera daeponensis TaxID=405746 RepID=A0ABS7NFB3_9RHOB|nr:lysophospholipid acyltransferase family protein [Leisingera daeponensis]MBY6056249.1 1-acyl-sn-glycerol-3-phosphate acyltransferase [Leisingera daeponensis]MBY6139870.1 1-acyl-sn-glycerol-3-phosphate acyltransferase [Leisingera daeponensis]